jgi:hypothetical protein
MRNTRATNNKNDEDKGTKQLDQGRDPTMARLRQQQQQMK